MFPSGAKTQRINIGGQKQNIGLSIYNKDRVKQTLKHQFNDSFDPFNKETEEDLVSNPTECVKSLNRSRSQYNPRA